MNAEPHTHKIQITDFMKNVRYGDTEAYYGIVNPLNWGLHMSRRGRIGKAAKRVVWKHDRGSRRAGHKESQGKTLQQVQRSLNALLTEEHQCDSRVCYHLETRVEKKQWGRELLRGKAKSDAR